MLLLLVIVFCYVGFIRTKMWKESCYIRKRVSLVLSAEDWECVNVGRQGIKLRNECMNVGRQGIKLKN